MKPKLILGAVFFCISFGLGYAPLNRYDPASVLGLSDNRSYTRMIEDKPGASPKHAIRILVPLLARPIDQIATGRIGSWKPALFALLVVNSAFVAWAAVLLLAIGEFLTGDRRIGLTASLIYLLTFNVTNFELAGLVDSVEAWALIAATWALLTKRWLLVPLIGFAGALGKETSIPLMLVFCIAWVVSLALARADEHPPYWMIAALVVGQIAAVELVRAILSGHLVPARQVSSAVATLIMPVQNFPVASMIRELLYSFVWLLPLGIPRLTDVPRVWIISSAASLVVVFVLTMSVSVGENATRPAFNVAGPILALSAAIFLNRILRSDHA